MLSPKIVGTLLSNRLTPKEKTGSFKESDRSPTKNAPKFALSGRSQPTKLLSASLG